jgi:hypothetical protein
MSLSFMVQQLLIQTTINWKDRGVILNSLIFLGIVVSIVGVTSDNLTTNEFIKDIGKESESNANFTKIRERWGYKAWIGIEAIIVVGFGICDLILNELFFSIAYGVFRGLAATHNFQIIGEYRTIGIDAFRENSKRRRQLFQRVSPINRYKMRLQYFACFFICIVALMLIFLIAYESIFQVDLFLTFLVAGLIFGIGGFFFRMGIID